MIFLPVGMPLPQMWTLLWLEDGHIYIAYFNFDGHFMKIYDSTASKLILQKLHMSRMELKNTYLEMRENIKEKVNCEKGSAC